MIRSSAEGYVATLKVLDIPADALEIVENVQVVLFKLADPVPIVLGEENILETSGEARIVIPAGTTFLDGNGNEVGGNVNAILNFIDPSNDNFDDSPGRFIIHRQEELMSFGVLNLQFQDNTGNSLTPEGDIRIALADTEVQGYKLWLLDNNGQWKKKKSGQIIKHSQAITKTNKQAIRRLASRSRRQASLTDLGSFGTGDIGRWINIDKVPNGAKKCYVKTRVFNDISFTNRGSYMSAHVLLNLLNELGKRDKMRGLPSILSLFRNEFNKFNNTRARMLDSIYHMTNTLKSHFWRKNVIILSLCTQRCYGRHNVSRKSINH